MKQAGTAVAEASAITVMGTAGASQGTTASVVSCKPLFSRSELLRSAGAADGPTSLFVSYYKLLVNKNMNVCERGIVSLYVSF